MPRTNLNLGNNTMVRNVIKMGLKYRTNFKTNYHLNLLLAVGKKISKGKTMKRIVQFLLIII